MRNKYQEVPGRQEGQVEVLVRQNVLDRWGEPDVDFEGLTEMVREAGLSPDTKLKLYSGRLVGDTSELRKLALGGRIPFTKTIHSAVGVNGRSADLPSRHSLPVERASRLEDSTTATMSKLIRNVLRASGVRGSELLEREQEMYAKHASDIQFKHSTDL